MIFLLHFLFGWSWSVVNSQICEIKGFSYFPFQFTLNLIFRFFYSWSHCHSAPTCKKNIFLSSKHSLPQLYSHECFIYSEFYFFLVLLHPRFLGIRTGSQLLLLHTPLLHLPGGILQTSLGMICCGHQA